MIHLHLCIRSWDRPGGAAASAVDGVLRGIGGGGRGGGEGARRVGSSSGDGGGGGSTSAGGVVVDGVGVEEMSKGPRTLGSRRAGST